MNLMRRPSILVLGVLCFAGLFLSSVEVFAASASAQMPAAVSSAANYVTANSSKSGFKVLGGALQGGGGPVAFSLITIYGAGTSGYGQGSVTGLGFTDEQGKIHAVYTGTPAQQLYLVASGGFVGGSNTYDTAIALSAPLGSFSGVPASVTVDEATTVAAAYALSQFLSSNGQILGTSPRNASGLANAVAVFANLASISSGTAATALVTGASGTPPTATVNSLANILAACIATGSPTSTQCASLFSAATPSGGVAPTTTLAAVLDIARNAGNNVAPLFALAGAGPFQPALTTVPNDWTLGINYAGGYLDSSSAPEGLAIDSAGNAWVSSAFSDSSINGGKGFVLTLSPQGAQGSPLLDNGNISNPNSVAIDSTGTVWITNPLKNTVSALSSDGASFNGSPFSGEMVSPSFLSVDRTGNVWVLSISQPFLTELPVASSYAPVNIAVSDGGTIGAVDLTALALDNSGNVYTADGVNNLLVVLSASSPTTQLAGSPFSGGGLNDPFGMAIDNVGNVWAENNSLQGFTEFVAAGSSFAPVQYTNNDLGRPGPVAMDGAGTAWGATADLTGRLGVVPVNAVGVPLAGSAGIFTGGGAAQRLPTAVALDASGNVWLAGGFGQNVVELVGAAKPVGTPLVGQAQLP